MPYKVVIHPDAAQEISRLDNRVRLLVFKQLKKLSDVPALGLPLGNKQGMDLTGYRKIYLDRKAIRIVYRIIEDKLILEVMAVGKREGMQVYQEASRRTQRE